MFNIDEWTPSIPRKTFSRKHGRRSNIWSRDLVYSVTEVHTRPRQWKHHSRASRSWSRLSCWPAIFEVYTHRDSPPCFYWLATCLYCGKKNRPGDTIRGKVKKIFRYGSIVWPYLAGEPEFFAVRWKRRETREVSRSSLRSMETRWRGAKVTGRGSVRIATISLYIENITRWREDMNFMFEWQEQYLTSERSERVRYCSCHENIKFISSS